MEHVAYLNLHENMAIKINQKRVETPHGVITLFTLINESGASVELSSLGAGILAVNVPDVNGKIQNVCLSYANPADYMADGPCMGKVPGRYANRIAKGHLEVDGKLYQLNINNGPNALHGGPTGFQNHIWDAEVIEGGVKFTLESPDGDEHYPANLTAIVIYRWNDSNELLLELKAVSDAKTVINLTNHSYWNLDGADSGSVLKHRMKILAHKYIPTDDTLIPTGEKALVEGTPMDFLCFKELGKDIEADFPALKYGKGYDAGWLLDNWEPGQMIEGAVEIIAPISGRRLVIDSDQPAAHVYTGNWLSGCPQNHSGRSYSDYDGVAVEMQGVPDAPNQPSFPSQWIEPGNEYQRYIRFKFC